MDKLNFVKNGASRLPPGFRFQPTDEELVFQYLKCKVLSCPLPASIIPEINVCDYDPWDLPGNCDEQERYFFSSKEAKYRNGNRMNRTTSSGYWKATGSDKRISSPPTNNGFGGIRKSLVFYQGKAPNGSRTNWVMREYRLVTAETSAFKNYVREIGDWVLCRIYMKSRTESSGGDMQKRNTVMNVDEVSLPRFFDFMMVHKTIPAAPRHSCTSSSCSSSTGIISVADHEETSASTTDF